MAPTSNAARTLTVVAVALAVAAPAVVLRALCIGRACERPTAASAPIPFCSLPPQLRSQLQAGFRDGRSPEVLAVTGASSVEGSSALPDRAGGTGVVWPSTAAAEPEQVPVVFWGAGVEPGPIDGSHTLADVAPTIAEIIHLDRPHPNVRSGRPMPGVAAPGGPPRLVLEIVLQGLGTDDLERVAARRWPELGRLMEEGATTTSVTTGSLPLDPAATLTTIGTGGLPSEHGITGTLVRNEEGKLVQAWGPGAPFSVISTLGDDLDELNDQRPWIGLVAGSDSDRGIIGGNWYPGGDRDDLYRWGGGELESFRAALAARPYGADRVPDLLVAVLEDPTVPRASQGAAELVRIAEGAVGADLAVVIVGTGSSPPATDPVAARRVDGMIRALVGADLVEATAVGGLFLDQGAVAEADASRQEVVEALRHIRASGGGSLFADAFTSIAVSLARYC